MLCKTIRNNAPLFVMVIALIISIATISVISHPSHDVAAQKPAGTDAFSVALNPKRDYLTIVNDTNEYKFGDTYDKELQKDIIYVSDNSGELTPIEKGTNAAFSLLKQRLREKGTEIELYSGYRTKDDQQWVYDYYSNLEGWAETNKVVKPGFSEHHTGLLLNIVVWWPDEKDSEKRVWTTETAERQAKNPDFRIIHENLADFGFIDRYPAGKEEITGMPSEPYEIRFVGSSKVAHEIMDSGLCLEEYLQTKNK